MIFPVENFVGDSPAEEDIWNLAKKAIPEECLSFHNYFLETKRPDIILLTPNRGVLIIEIKGFLAKNIKSVPDSTVIKFYNSPAKRSPFNQAIEYRNKLIEMMGGMAELKPTFIAVAVCYPYINRDDFYEKKLNKISMEEMTILEEDVANEESFNEKIERIYEFVYQSMGMHFGQVQFEGEILKRIAYLIAPDFDKDIAIEEKWPQLPVTSRVEYYSKLITFSKKIDKAAVELLVDEWFAGGKLYLFFSEEDDYEWFLEYINSKLKEKGKTNFKPFEKINCNMPNLVFAYVSDISNDIEILNGEDYEKYNDCLVEFV